MPGPMYYPPPDRRAASPPARGTVAATLGASYVYDPGWTPGPMAPPPAFNYPDVWAKKRKKP